MRRAKIVATLGPATSSYENIRAIIDAGVDVCRMNLSHGTYDVHEGIYATVGALYTQPLTFRVDDLSIIAQAMDKVASTPPTELAGSPVAKVEKFAQGSKFFTDNDDRVIVRPSGTEPKLKCYLESPDADRLDAIAADLRAYFEI